VVVCLPVASRAAETRPVMDFLLKCFVRAVGLPGRTIQYGEECGLSVGLADLCDTIGPAAGSVPGEQENGRRNCVCLAVLRRLSPISLASCHVFSGVGCVSGNGRFTVQIPALK